MASASRTVVLTVDTQRGSKDEARSVLQDVIEHVRASDVHYLSVGKVRVQVRKVHRS